MGTDAKPSRRRLNQIMRQKAEAEFDRLNPAGPYIPARIPNNKPQAPSKQRHLRRWEQRLLWHQELYARFIRRYSTRLSVDSPLRADIRYWEARICGVRADDFPQWFWFCGLSQLAIADLCWLTRRCRERKTPTRR